jgi:poly(A) polymerase
MIAIEPRPDPLRRLAALIDVDEAGAAALAERLRLSKARRHRLRGLAPPWPSELGPGADPLGDPAAQRRALYRLGAERSRDLALLLAAEGQLGAEQPAGFLALAGDWRPPSFPLSGHDVTALGIPPGPGVGALLEAVERWWEDSDFAAGRDRCLARLQELAAATANPPQP